MSVDIVKTPKVKQLKINKRADVFASWMFITPAFIFLAITALFPLLYSVYLSFFKYKMNLPNQTPLFVGFDNYIRLFTDKTLGQTTWNTIIFAVISVTAEIFVGLFVAMVICSDKKWARIAMSIFIIPMIMAPVAAGTLWRMMLDSATGVINYLLGFIGIEPISWLAQPATAMAAVIFVNIWQLAPWVTVILAAGLKALPAECLQAALVDGASKWQIFRKIVLPLIKPLLIVVVMIRFIDAFKVFDTIYVMTGGGPGIATKMLPNYIYEQGLKYFDAGYSAALAIVFVLVMSLISLYFVKWRKKEEVDL